MDAPDASWQSALDSVVANFGYGVASGWAEALAGLPPAPAGEDAEVASGASLQGDEDRGWLQVLDALSEAGSDEMSVDVAGANDDDDALGMDDMPIVPYEAPSAGDADGSGGQELVDACLASTVVAAAAKSRRVGDDELHQETLKVSRHYLSIDRKLSVWVHSQRCQFARRRQEGRAHDSSLDSFFLSSHGETLVAPIRRTCRQAKRWATNRVVSVH